jgi:amino acid transporter/catechol 2,3-dioxygenase-like lactoylglutathione lyase family enzyme
MRRDSVWSRLRAAVLGRPRDLADRSLFHKLSLVAVLAWVGLGADGLSSSCYGPEETYKALGRHPALAVFVAVACVVTVGVLCASYRQIIELFPTGGGGYLVATKLLGRGAGVVSGSALLVDYVLTITISVASGADALFSLLPADYQAYKLPFACAGIAGMTVLNLRGVRESVLLWAPVFFAFIGTHAVAILVAVGLHLADVSAVTARTADGVRAAHAELGLAGVLVLMARAFAVGAGTYTGIEAVSNGLPVLREPQVQTGKRTMTLMGVSLGVTVFGLLLAYLLVGVEPAEGKTLNAVLFEAVTAGWPGWLGRVFVVVSLVSATALLFIAAQAGFLDGPRVLATMALDRWLPTRFATLSDRFVAQNGILLMGGAALAVLVLTGGLVGLLVVLYSINVFLTFTLSQLGMCAHWVGHRGRGWRRGLAVNGLGLVLTGSILLTLCVVKFREGGWVTLVATAGVVGLAGLIRRHYARSAGQLRALDDALAAVEADPAGRPIPRQEPGRGRTAVLLCNGYNGLGVHAFFRVFRMFPATFDRCVFVLVGTVDTGSFKGAEAIDRLRVQTEREADRYAELCRRCGLARRCRRPSATTWWRRSGGRWTRPCGGTRRPSCSAGNWRSCRRPSGPGGCTTTSSSPSSGSSAGRACRSSSSRSASSDRVGGEAVMGQAISRVAVVVREYDEAIAYYTGVLGFEVLADDDLGGGKRWVLVAPPGGAGTALLLARAANPVQAARVGDQTGGRVFLFLHTDDCRRDYDRLVARGVRFEGPPRREAYGTVAVFADLYGNRWDLVQPAGGRD